MLFYSLLNSVIITDLSKANKIVTGLIRSQNQLQQAPVPYPLSKITELDV